jgi:hypothetical protein
VVVPDGDPGELLVREKQVKVGAVGRKTTPVVVQGENFSFRLNGTGGGRGRIFVDVVAELNRGQLSNLAVPRSEVSGVAVNESREIGFLDC